MRRFLSTACLPVLAALLALVSITAGCDSGGADASDFHFIEGAWTVERIAVNGQPYQRLLETRYPNGVVFAFIESDGLRTFRLVGSTKGGETLIAEGSAGIDGEENTLFLDASPNFFAVIDYEIESSNRVMLTAGGQDAVELAQRLLGIGISQGSRVSLTILQK